MRRKRTRFGLGFRIRDGGRGAHNCGSNSVIVVVGESQEKGDADGRAVIDRDVFSSGVTTGRRDGDGDGTEE